MSCYSNISSDEELNTSQEIYFISEDHIPHLSLIILPHNYILKFYLNPFAPTASHKNVGFIRVEAVFMWSIFFFTTYII